MSPRQLRRLIYLALVVAFVVRHDFWQWSDPTTILGIPVGLAYHVAFCFGVAILMAVLVRFAWPARLGAGAGDRESA